MKTLIDTPTPSAKLISSQTYLNKILQKNGPDPEDYDLIHQQLHAFQRQYVMERKELVQTLQTSLSKVLTTDTMIGWGYTKPYGYAGDFQIIDNIYQQKVSPDPKFYKWDLFFNDFTAARAVRNRKTYFKNLLLKNTLAHQGTYQVLNVASGPARDLLEFLEENPGVDIHFTCIELDVKAIAYAKNLLKDHLDKVTFIQQNIFRFRSTAQFDLVWSAGLFDYFEDSVFVRIFQRLLTNVKSNGKMVIGNFHPRNESRPVMEIIGDWYLHHRTNAELEDLAQQAGVAKNAICIEAEPEGVNLFLQVKCK